MRLSFGQAFVRRVATAYLHDAWLARARPAPHVADSRRPPARVVSGRQGMFPMTTPLFVNVRDKRLLK